MQPRVAPAPSRASPQAQVGQAPRPAPALAAGSSAGQAAAVDAPNGPPQAAAHDPRAAVAAAEDLGVHDRGSGPGVAPGFDPDELTIPAVRPATKSRRMRSQAGAVAGSAAAADDKYRAGEIIAGRYRLVRVIGEGGMGFVWLAKNLTLDIDVAIKLIRRDRAAPEAPARLLQEARATARLGHPSIVRTFDFGESEHGDPFIVMEVLSGESLADVIDRKGKLPPIIAVQTLLPVASALVEAHAKGIIHRDLKPENIMIVKDEAGSLIPKVVDFGIAKLVADVERRYTLAGELLGSPDYMSPEQARGEGDVDERADVWALSVMLYELVCGTRPFDAANYNALLTAILTREPAPATELSSADPALWAILERGLAKSVSARFATMRELGTALATWAIEHGVEEDVAGTSLPAHWLAGSSRRQLSQYPPSAERPSWERISGTGPAAHLPGGAAQSPAGHASVEGAASPRSPLAPPALPVIAGAWPPSGEEIVARADGAPTASPSQPGSPQQPPVDAAHAASFLPPQGYASPAGAFGAMPAPNRVLWIAAGFAAVMVLGLVGLFAVRGRLLAGPAPMASAAVSGVAPATSAAAAAIAVVETAAPAPPATADPSAAASADPSASASADAPPATSGSAKAKPPKRRRSAPPAPKNITF